MFGELILMLHVFIYNFFLKLEALLETLGVSICAPVFDGSGGAVML